MKTITTAVQAEEPQGAPFVIDRLDFAPSRPMSLEYDGRGIPQDKLENWPMVYILANDEEAYVGQTTSASRRVAQHGANPEKKAFTTVNLIFNREFNASVITDYEHRLIQYMHGDGRYRLTNKNDGMTDTNYFSKSKYGEMFEDLWGDLRRLRLAEKTIDEIEESDIFKYSPFKGLNGDQLRALDEILARIKRRIGAKEDGSAHPIVVEGMPGTGKTVLAIYLLKQLKDDPACKGRNIRLVEPATALRKTLRRALKTVSGMTGQDIIAPADVAKSGFGFKLAGERGLDVALVDEAHLLKRRVNLGTQFGNFDKTCESLGLLRGSSQVDWILSQAKVPVFFYDPLQSIGPSGVPREALRQALGAAFDHPIRLETQMRVKGGRGYLDYIHAILDGRSPEPRAFSGYDLAFHEDFRSFLNGFRADLARSNLTRMLAGFAWEWKTNPKRRLRPGEAPADHDIEIEGVRLRWNRVQENWVGLGVDDPAAAREVGCIHSIQGYDLSRAYVIIGRDIKLDRDTGRLVADKRSYFDKNGKNTATQGELDEFVRHVYYVLLTRGIYGTHIYVVDPELRAYLARFFPRSAEG